MIDPTKVSSKRPLVLSPSRVPERLGIQRSFQSLVCEPLIICHCSPCLIASRPSKMLAQAHEDLPPFLASKKWPSGKYLPLKTWTHRASSSWRILQLCFAKRATLKSWILLNPIPPSNLDNCPVNCDVPIIYVWVCEWLKLCLVHSAITRVLIKVKIYPSNTKCQKIS